MKIRHLIAIVPAAVLVLAGCSGSNEDTAAPAQDEETTAAIAEVCRQVATLIDTSEEQAGATGEPFDRAAAGDEFMGLLMENTSLWTSAYNLQAEAAGKPELDPALASWEDLPEEFRDVVEQAVQNGVAGTC
ncbi:hypothetical protein [Rhodococcus xishaensis]|uniref:Lipoprotein n=1 Tax=Rhodococcus xishaensis TaxID=2487364 RepID=A0A3S3DYL6_9NOCA|nr:hypothetical protein [Rhodococcus xishaensis]RVW01257.1 hypothetical protein EGT50_13565 [Rhodococcus xishaensis]